MGDGRVETPLHYQGERRVVTGTVKKTSYKKKRKCFYFFRIFSKASFLLRQVSEFAVKKTETADKNEAACWNLEDFTLHNMHCPAYNKHKRQWGCTLHCSVECPRWSCQGRPLVGSSGARTESGLVSALHVGGRLGRKWEGTQEGKHVFFFFRFSFSLRCCGLENEYSAVV